MGKNPRVYDIEFCNMEKETMAECCNWQSNACQKSAEGKLLSLLNTGGYKHGRQGLTISISKTALVTKSEVKSQTLTC